MPSEYFSQYLRDSVSLSSELSFSIIFKAAFILFSCAKYNRSVFDIEKHKPFIDM